jgi:hypothetical protein
MNAPGQLVDWSQFSELIGDPGDRAQRPLLAGMWCDMVADLKREMAAFGAMKTDAEAKAMLHRLRGLVAMWGLSEVALRMKAIEDSPSPLADLHERIGELSDITELSCGEITVRHAWLETDGAE